MDDALAVGLVQGVRDLDAVAQHLLGGERAPAQAIREGLALEVLHDQEVGAVLLADVEERADVGMVQAGHGPRFALEALAQVGVGREMLGQDLEGDGAVEPRVLRAVDLAHPARPEGGQDLVGPELGARFERHGFPKDGAV